MLIVAIFFLILVICFFVMGVALDAPEYGFFAILCLLFVFVFGTIWLIQNDSQTVRHDHLAIYRDLSDEGWNISTSDIHAADDPSTVDVGCLRLTVAKLGSRWQVVTTRSAAAGGGYKVISPSAQAALKKSVGC